MLSGSIRQLWMESLNMYSAYMAAASIDAMKQIGRQTVSIYSFPETHITGMNSRNNQEVGNQPALSGEDGHVTHQLITHIILLWLVEKTRHLEIYCEMFSISGTISVNLQDGCVFVCVCENGSYQC